LESPDISIRHFIIIIIYLFIYLFIYLPEIKYTYIMTQKRVNSWHDVPGTDHLR